MTNISWFRGPPFFEKPPYTNNEWDLATSTSPPTVVNNADRGLYVNLLRSQILFMYLHVLMNVCEPMQALQKWSSHVLVLDQKLVSLTPHSTAKRSYGIHDQKHKKHWRPKAHVETAKNKLVQSESPLEDIVIELLLHHAASSKGQGNESHLQAASFYIKMHLMYQEDASNLLFGSLHVSSRRASHTAPQLPRPCTSPTATGLPSWSFLSLKWNWLRRQTGLGPSPCKSLNDERYERSQKLWNIVTSMLHDVRSALQNGWVLQVDLLQFAK